MTETKTPTAVTKTEVQSKVDVAHATMIEKIGGDIIRKTGELGGLYLQLCKYIRQNKIAPKLVSITLTKQGFKRSRISEINRVAQASEKLFKDYEAKLIGFDKCLEFSRIENGKPTPTDAAALLMDSGAVTGTETADIIKTENEPGEPKKTQSTSIRIKGHIAAACKLAVKREYVFTFNNYRVTMTRLAPGQAVTGE